MAAVDGQTLQGQSAETQAAFQAIHGDQAASAWEAEHNAAIGAPAPEPAPAPAAAAPAPAAPQTAPGTVAPAQYPGVTAADLSRISAGFAASSGLSIKQLNEQMRQFDATLDWQKQMWQQQGLPQLAIQQRAADLEQRKFEELTQQAARQQSFVEEQGRRQATLAEKSQSDANAIATGQLDLSRQTQLGQLALGQSQLGLDTLKTASTLTGPADWIRAANFTRGVRQTNLPSFITQLLTGAPTAALPGGGGGTGATMSEPNTLTGLANTLGAGGGAAAGAPATPATSIAGTGSPGVDYAANRLRALYAMGGQALAPQSMEGLTPTELDMFKGGGADVGADVPGFLAQYQRSRIGQTTQQPGQQAA